MNLRLKALKRQMDEAEEEIDRLEHSKKKLQRDLDEQQETNEQLQSQLKALRSEMRWTHAAFLTNNTYTISVSWFQYNSVLCRRKSTSAPLLNHIDDDDDDVSTDGETYFSSSSGYKRSSSQDNILSTFALWTNCEVVNAASLLDQMTVEQVQMLSETTVWIFSSSHNYPGYLFWVQT